jgi:phenylacetate-CoA oxygenase PaaH subunit
VDVWEVFSRRTNDDPLVHVGSVSAPDLEMALVLARETFFRHGEGVDCWVGRRGDLHRVADPETLGGVTDKTYRRAEGYTGVGAKLKRVHSELASRGVAIDNPRPGR